MSRIRIAATLATVLMGQLILSGASASGQRSIDNLLEQRITLHIKQGTFLYALSTLNVDKRIPIGFEVALGHKAEYPHKLLIPIRDQFHFMTEPTSGVGSVIK